MARPVMQLSPKTGLTLADAMLVLVAAELSDPLLNRR